MARLAAVLDPPFDVKQECLSRFRDDLFHRVSGRYAAGEAREVDAVVGGRILAEKGDVDGHLE
jgi:hypothetical protein